MSTLRLALSGIALSLALSQPLWAETPATPAGSTPSAERAACQEGAQGQRAQHRHLARSERSESAPNWNLAEIETLMQARALRLGGSGATAELTPLSSGGYQVVFKQADGSVIRNLELDEQGRPTERMERGQRRGPEARQRGQATSTTE